MKFVGKMRGAWARRLTVAAVAAAVLPGLVGRRRRLGDCGGVLKAGSAGRVSDGSVSGDGP